MQLRNGLVLLFLSAAACSGADSTPTGPRPSFASGGGSCTVTLTHKNITVTVPAHSSGVARFTAKNVDCASSSNWLMSAARTGAVSGVTSVTPNIFLLTIGQSKSISVNYTTGAPGQGSIIAHGGVDSPGADLYDTMTVTVQ
jgi:hypothetical protein